METAESLRRQLEVAEGLHSVVTTMKALAAVEMREYERAVQALVESVRVIQFGFQILFRHDQALVPADEPPGNAATIVVVFGSDQGLCGPLNRSIVRYALAQVGSAQIMAVGLRVARELEMVERPPAATFGSPSSLSGVGDSVDALLVALDEMRRDHPAARVVLVHHRPRGRLGYEPRVSTVVPLDTRLLQAISRRPWPTRQIPSFAGDARLLLQALTRQAVSYSFHRAFTEARASEHAGRLIAMQNAEQSIADRVEELSLGLRRVRQATVTAELLDVVAGFEAVQGPR